MKITIENTSKTVELVGHDGRVQARIWEGKTDSGIPVICYVTRIAVRDDAGDSARPVPARAGRMPEAER